MTSFGYFGPTERPLFGCFHAPPVESARATAVLLCNPWGREKASAHMSLKAWAEALAADGWPTLRFDMPGTGDSSGDPLRDDAGPQAWVASTRDAIDALKALAGVERVCVLGVRTGFLVACKAVVERSDVLGMVGVAPVVRGGRYLRELTALYAASRKSDVSLDVDHVFQSGGYVLSEAGKAAFTEMDIAQDLPSQVPHWLVLERDDMPAPKPWVDALAAAGARVACQALPGYAGMMADPHLAKPPQAMIAASLAWLQDIGPERALDETSKQTLRPLADMDIPSGIDGADVLLVREQAVTIPDSGNAGVLTSPLPGAQVSGRAVLILNAGSTRRSGPSRMSVTLARHRAARGDVCLRFDLSGLGDSPTRGGSDGNVTYPVTALQDLQAAIAFLRAQPHVQQVRISGLCAGAYHALLAARSGVAVERIVLINPLVYFNADTLSWQDGDISDRQVIDAAANYKASLFSADKWRKLMSGGVRLGPMMQLLMLRIQQIAHARVRAVLRALGISLKDDLASTLRLLRGRGVRVNFIFAEGDPGETMLREQVGGALPRLMKTQSVTVDVFPYADHVFTELKLRQKMMERLEALLDAP